MAHVEKITRSSVFALLRHDARSIVDKDDVSRKNESIDPTRTHLNYSLLYDANKIEQTLEESIKYFNKRLSAVYCLNRKNVNVMCSWVVTLPPRLQNSDEKTQRDFFEFVHKWLGNRYGWENLVSSWVHMDETTPHMHYKFIPVVYDEKKEREKVCAKEVIDRTELEKFHQELSQACEKKFGVDVGILNDQTIGNDLTVEDLKNLSSATKKLNRRKDKLEAIVKTLESTVEKLKEAKSFLENEVNLLREKLVELINSIKALSVKKTELQDSISSLEQKKDYLISATKAAKDELSGVLATLREPVTKIPEDVLCELINARDQDIPLSEETTAFIETNFQKGLRHLELEKDDDWLELEEDDDWLEL